MSRIRFLNLHFDLQKKNLKSREDCIVIALHCLLLDKDLLCAGVGEAWLDSNSTPSELLPEEWNSDQEDYTLRYITKDKQTRLLLKIIKMEHKLIVHVVKNEDAVVSTSFQVENFVENDYNDYSSTYKNLESLSSSFRDVIEKALQNDPNRPSSSGRSKRLYRGSSPMPSAPPRPSTNLQPAREPFRYRFPEVGTSDLDPTGQTTGGGMFLDPSGIGIPPRPTVPKGIPKGSVPPGARFDPFLPPEPDPEYRKPPASDDSDDSD